MDDMVLGHMQEFGIYKGAFEHSVAFGLRYLYQEATACRSCIKSLLDVRTVVSLYDQAELMAPI